MLACWSVGSSQKGILPSSWIWVWRGSSGRALRSRKSSISCRHTAERIMLEPLFERFRQRDRLALSRLLSIAARGEELEEIAQAIPQPAKPSRVVAITGSGGVGK